MQRPGQPATATSKKHHDSPGSMEGTSQVKEKKMRQILFEKWDKDREDDVLQKNPDILTKIDIGNFSTGCTTNIQHILRTQTFPNSFFCYFFQECNGSNKIQILAWKWLSIAQVKIQNLVVRVK